MMGFAGCQNGFGGMGFMGGGFLFYGIVLLLIILAIVYFTKNNHKQNSALEVLNQEYAKGNVSDDDYQKRKDNLNR